MRPVKTPSSNGVFTLDGGTEDNDLWCERTESDDGTPVTWSVWVPTAEERAAIAAGRNLGLAVFGGGHPPVSLSITEEQPVSPREGELVDQAGTLVTVKLARNGKAIGERSYPAVGLQTIGSLSQAFERSGEKLEFEVIFDPPVKT